MVRRLLEGSRFLAAVAAVGLLVAAAATLGWGAYGVFDYVRELVDGSEDVALVRILSTIDLFLLSTVLLVFAVGLWELFVSDLDVPDWLEIESLDDLKKKLADVIVLVVSIKALEKFVTAKRPGDAVQYAVAAVLIATGLSLGTLVKAAAGRGDRSSASYPTRAPVPGRLADDDH